MARVRQRHTAAEVVVRRALWKAGARYRLHYKKLPGTPDLVFPGKKVAVFVHGCFWHGHTCPRGRRPSSNSQFWSVKLDKNQARDARVQAELRRIGWKPLVVWECEPIEVAVERVMTELAPRPA